MSTCTVSGYTVSLIGSDGWPVWAFHGDGAGDPYVCLPMVPHSLHCQVPTVSCLSHSRSFSLWGMVFTEAQILLRILNFWDLYILQNISYSYFSGKRYNF